MNLISPADAQQLLQQMAGLLAIILLLVLGVTAVIHYALGL